MFKLLAFWILGCGLDQSGWLILSFVMQQIGCLFGIGLFCRWLLSKAIYGVFSPGAFNCVPLQCCRSAGENVALRVFFLCVFFFITCQVQTQQSCPREHLCKGVTGTPPVASLSLFSVQSFQMAFNGLETCQCHTQHWEDSIPVKVWGSWF